MTIKELYCPFCQKKTKPIKALVTYSCPKCGATFMASQVEVQNDLPKSKKNNEAVCEFESGHGA